MCKEVAALTGALDEATVVLLFCGEGERERAASQSRRAGNNGKR
jgi:hypothetical protein